MSGVRSRDAMGQKDNARIPARLPKKRMEKVDEEFLKASIDLIDRPNRGKKPFLVLFNSTRMHISTRT